MSEYRQIVQIQAFVGWWGNARSEDEQRGNQVSMRRGIQVFPRRSENWEWRCGAHHLLPERGRTCNNRFSLNYFTVSNPYKSPELLWLRHNNHFRTEYTFWNCKKILIFSHITGSCQQAVCQLTLSRWLSCEEERSKTPPEHHEGSSSSCGSGGRAISCQSKHCWFNS